LERRPGQLKKPGPLPTAPSDQRFSPSRSPRRGLEKFFVRSSEQTQTKTPNALFFSYGKAFCAGPRPLQLSHLSKILLAALAILGLSVLVFSSFPRFLFAVRTAAQLGCRLVVSGACDSYLEVNRQTVGPCYCCCSEKRF